jgi:hypothetical protein
MSVVTRGSAAALIVVAVGCDSPEADFVSA